MNSKTINQLIREWSGIQRDDFDSDLNAMHKVEEHLITGAYPGADYDYTVNIRSIVGYTGFRFIHATASQRAEALLRTIGKWQD